MPAYRGKASTKPSPVIAVLTSIRSSKWSAHWVSGCMPALRAARPLDYFAVDYQRLWDTVHSDLPPLIEQLGRILEDVGRA